MDSRSQCSALKKERKEAMYTVKVSNGGGTAEKRFRSREKAIEVARETSGVEFIRLRNSEMTPEQKKFKVGTVRVYDNHGNEIEY